MFDLFKVILKFIWIIISNTYVLPFLITGIVFFISRKFDIWYGVFGGKVVYVIISVILFIIFNWNKLIKSTTIPKSFNFTRNFLFSAYSVLKLIATVLIQNPILIFLIIIVISIKKISSFL